MTIESALREFFQNRAEARVLVGVNEWGRLQALVASHGVEGEDRDQVRDSLWKFLRQKVSQAELAYLYGIAVLTRSEFDSRVQRVASPGGSTDVIVLKGLPKETVDD